MLVLVGGIHKGVLQALQFAEMQRRWVRHGIDVELEIAIDPYRDLNRAIIELIESIDARWEQDRMIVVIPEFVVHHWWGHLLHNQTSLFLKARLLFKENIAVVSIPYHV